MLSSLIAVGAALFSGSALATPSGPILPGHQPSMIERDGVAYNVFNHEATGVQLQFVNNSGICETTTGVKQYSGYLSVGGNMNMFFWFFEARNNPSTAPLATWFNGGPGCSSMIGLFQENGPCHFENGSNEPSLNEDSWNTNVNMLYIDQPIGVGFSYGTQNVDSTASAAPYVWKLLQAFFDAFPDYKNRDFGVFTESYGGHYGPAFAEYFLEQDSSLKSGDSKLNLVALGVNNGWFDAETQYKAYIDFSWNNTYKPIISESAAQSYYDSYTSSCQPAVRACTSSGSDKDCANAQQTCYRDIEGALTQAADFDVYDIREPSNDPYPPKTYSTYLARADVMKAIGARSKYTECADGPYQKFAQTGDNSRSTLKSLSNVVKSGSVTTLMWAGDADWICNWFGNLDVANMVDFDGASSFANASLEPYTVGGTETGTFKTKGKLSFMRVYGAGHEVPYYQPKIARQAFEQTMAGQTVGST